MHPRRLLKEHDNAIHDWPSIAYAGLRTRSLKGCFVRFSSDLPSDQDQPTDVSGDGADTSLASLASYQHAIRQNPVVQRAWPRSGFVYNLIGGAEGNWTARYPVLLLLFTVADVLPRLRLWSVGRRPVWACQISKRRLGHHCCRPSTSSDLRQKD